MITIRSEDYIGMGYFLKSRRKALGICKDSICDKLNITLGILNNWENENLENIGLEEMINLANILKYYPKIFIDGVPMEAYENWNNFINQEFIK